LWNQDQIAEGIALTESALASHRFGAYTLQAAIAAVPRRSAIRSIYRLAADRGTLRPADFVSSHLRSWNSPRRCRRHVRHPEKGLALIDALLARGELANYYLAHSARAELCRRLGRLAEASASYEKALALVWQESDRRFLARGCRN